LSVDGTTESGRSQRSPSHSEAAFRPRAADRTFRLNEYGEMIGIRLGYIKRAGIGWFALHRHDAAASNEPYAYSYLFVYAIEVPSGVSTFT
jgi:hypothetical protein